MNSKNIVLLAILGIILVVLFMGCGGYNGLVSADEAAKKSWGNVEAQYQRRADLIPNLVNTVKAVSDKETKGYADIAALRTGTLNAKKVLDDPNATEAAKMQAMNMIDKNAKAALAINVENYPNFKFPENYSQLQHDLTETENMVVTARKDYNTAVADYNVKVRKFPMNLLSGMFGFKQRDEFKADPGAKNAPKVEF